MNNKTLILSILLVLSCFPVEAENLKPNILLITADDLGYGDLGVNNNPFVKTPNIDKLASDSVTFSDYSVSPVCSTTRASLLTGRQFYKTGVSGVHGGRDYLNKSEILISQMLKEAGYENGFWGKWHSGKSRGYMPWERGFDEAYYAELYRHKNNFGFLNGEPIAHDKWVSEVVTDYAIDFIKRSQHKNKPFFAYISFLAPHEPWLAPDKFVQPYLEKNLRPAVANLYGMITEMDYHIGRLLQFLDDANLSDDTIVIFMSDNGPWWDSSNFGSMTKQEWITRNPIQLQGNKGQTWQNGIKSPLFIRNKTRFSPNKVERFVNVNDIVPTILELTNTEKPKHSKPFDGHSFAGYLKGKTEGPNLRTFYIGSHDVVSNKPLFNQWTPIDSRARSGMSFNSQMIGLRKEKYKLLLNPSLDRDSHPKDHNSFALFDIPKDPSEKNNIVLERPKIAKEMKSQLNKIFSAIKDDRSSFLPPEYLVDEELSVINAFAPSSTFGNTLSKAHVLSGMKNINDGAEYNIRVKKPNTYKISIEQTNTDSVGIEIQISTGKNVISTEFDGRKLQYVGDLYLDKDTSTLKISVVNNNSIKPWAEISGFRRIYIQKLESRSSPLTLKIPN